MNDATLLMTALRNLRRNFAGNIAGLETFANNAATMAQGNPVTLTHTQIEGGAGGGQVTMLREIWLVAAEELLADPNFNPDALPRQPRVIIPDFRRSLAV